MTRYLIIIALCSAIYGVYKFILRPANLSKQYSGLEEFKALPKKDKHINYSFFISGIVSIVLLFITSFKFQFASIPSPSMMPNYTVGQRILIDHSAFGIRSPLDNWPLTQGREPIRGEAIVTQFPINPQILYLKRVIGLPGDYISLNKNALNINGAVYPISLIGEEKFTLNDVENDYEIYEVQLPESRWKLMVMSGKEFPVIKPTQIPEGGYFLLGDNLTGSSDSREFGPISAKFLVASVLGI